MIHVWGGVYLPPDDDAELQEVTEGERACGGSRAVSAAPSSRPSTPPRRPPPPQVEDTKLFVSHRFARRLLQAQVPFQLHVVVGPVDSESIAKVNRRVVAGVRTAQGSAA